jgi:hypothetical protein
MALMQVMRLKVFIQDTGASSYSAEDRRSYSGYRLASSFDDGHLLQRLLASRSLSTT